MNYFNTIPAETLLYVFGSLTGFITVLFIYLKLSNMYTISNYLISSFAIVTICFFTYNYFTIENGTRNLLNLPVIHDIVKLVTP
ncbi:hypothetical protein ACQUY5_30250 [Bacillus cereus]|uniref:hypothetical protein n=1 Tax=Bacillus cereus TaxID=1396 RepID=UPI003D162E36